MVCRQLYVLQTVYEFELRLSTRRWRHGFTRLNDAKTSCPIEIKLRLFGRLFGHCATSEITLIHDSNSLQCGVLRFIVYETHCAAPLVVAQVVTSGQKRSHAVEISKVSEFIVGWKL